MRIEKNLALLFLLILINFFPTNNVSALQENETIFEGVVSPNYPMDTDLLIEGTEPEEIEAGQLTFATNWDQVLMGESGPMAGLIKMFKAAVAFSQNKTMIGLPSDSAGFLDLSVDENLTEVRIAIGQLQAFAYTAEIFGTNLAKFGSDSAVSLNVQSVTPDNIFGLLAGAKVYLEASMVMGSLIMPNVALIKDAKNNVVGPNYFGKQVFSQELRSIIIEGLKIVRGMYFSILKARGYSNPRDLNVLRAVSWLTDLDRRGLLAPASALPLAGKSIDAILNNLGTNKIIESTKPLILITMKKDATWRYTNIDETGLVTGIPFNITGTSTSPAIPADSFNYSDSSVVTFHFDCTTMGGYIFHKGTGKFIGAISKNSALLQTDKSKALERSSVLGQLYLASGGDSDQALIDYVAVNAFTYTLITELKKPNFIDKYNALKNQINDPNVSLTIDQCRAVCLLLRKIFDDADTSPESALVIDSSINDILGLLVNIRKKYAKYFTDQSLIDMLGDKPADNETDLAHIIKITFNDPKRIYSKIKEARKIFPYSTRIKNISSRFESITTPDAMKVFLMDLAEITSLTDADALKTLVTPTTTSIQFDTSKLGSIVQAFPEDITAIQTILKAIEFKPAYQTALTSDSKIADTKTQITKNIAASVVVEEYMEDLKAFEAARPNPFTTDEQNLFLKKLDRILDFRISAVDISKLNKDLTTLINKVKFNQMKAAAADLEQRMSNLGSYGGGAFNAAVQELKNIELIPSRVNEFMNKVDELVAMKIEANMRDIDELTNYLEGNKVLMNPAIFFDNTGTLNKRLATAVQVLRQPVAFSNRISNLNLFLQNNPKGSVEKFSGDILFQKFVNPFFEKVEWMIFNKDAANELNLNNANKLINFAIQNQLQTKMTLTIPSTGPAMFVGKRISEAIELASSQLQWIPGGRQTLVDKLNVLNAKLQKLSSADTDAAKTLVGVDVPRLLMQKIDYADAELTAFKNFLEALRWNSAIKEMLFTVSSPAPAQTDQKITDIVDNCFSPYLNKKFSFAEVLSLIQMFEAMQPLDPDQQKTFISRTKKLFLMLDQATDTDLEEATIFFKNAMYNYMSSGANDIQQVINKIVDLQNLRATKKANENIQDFSKLLNEFKLLFAEMTTQNYNQKKVDSDKEDRLTSLVTLCKSMSEIKLYSLENDFTNLISFLGSAQFTSNEIILYQGGMTLFDPIIKKLKEPIPFLLQIDALKNLTKNLIETTSAQSTTSIQVTDFRVNILKEKLKILINGAADLYKNKTNLNTDIFPIIDSLARLDSLNPMIAREVLNIQGISDTKTTTKDKINAIKDKIRASYRNQELFYLTFTDKVVQIDGMISKITTEEDAGALYDYLSGLLEKRVEANNNDLSNFTKLVNKAIYQNNFVDLLQTYKKLTSKSEASGLMNDLLAKINNPILNQERANWLLDMLNSQILAPHHPDLIIRVLGDLIRAAASDDSANSQIMLLIETCKKSIYRTMSSAEAKMNSLITSLSTVANRQSLATVSIEIQQLQRDLDALDTQADLDRFLSDVQTQVAKKLELQEDDIAQLNSILAIVQNKRAYSNAKSTKKDLTSGLTYEQAVKGLIDQLNKAPSFNDRFATLKAFYERNIVLGASTEEDKQEFIKQVQKTMALKTDNLIRFEDDEAYDKVYALILLLQEAAYDKLQSMKTTLLQLANELITYRNGIKPKMTPLYRTRVLALKTKLNSVNNLEIAKSFVQDCRGLANDIILATPKVASDLNTWLLKDLILNNQSIFRAGLVDEIKKIAADFKGYDKIPLQNRYTELQRMIQEYGDFTVDLKIEFYEKLDDLVKVFKSAATSTSKPSATLKDQIIQVINFAKTGIFTTEEAYNKDSLGGNVGSAQKFTSALTTMINDLNSIDFSGVMVRMFEDRINDFLTKFDSKTQGVFDNQFKNITAQNVDEFVTTLQTLIADKVDGTKTDLDNLLKIINAESLKTNAFLYRKFNSFDYINTFKLNYNKPVSYLDRVTNMKNFAEQYFFKDDATISSQIKRIFVDKSILLFEERWKAQDESFDLKTIRDLIYAILINKFNKTTEEQQVTTLTQIVNNFLVPIAAPKKDLTVYDFRTDIDSLKTMFKNLSDETFQAFVAKIGEIANRRINAVYEDNATTNQAEDLYRWLNDREVKINEIVFKAGNQQKVAQASQALIQPVTFTDAFQNLYNYVMDSPAFDSQGKRLFMKKLEKLTKIKDLATKENFDLTKLSDLIEFVKNNRLGYDPDSKVVMDNQLNSIKTNVSTDSFATLLAAIKKNYIDGGQILSTKEIKFVIPQGKTAKNFVDDCDKLLSYKNDSLKNELNDIITILKSSSVIYNRDIKLSDTLSSKLADLTDKFSIAIPFADYAANLVGMLQNLTTFSTDDVARFTNKLKNLVDMRSEAYDNGYDMKKLGEWILYGLSNQLSNNADVKSLLDTLMQKPVIKKSIASASQNNYKPFRQRLTEQKDAFSQITAKDGVIRWLNGLQKELIDNRIDGLKYGVNVDTNEPMDDDALILDLINFLKNKVKPSYYVFKDTKNLKQQVDNYVSALEVKPEYSDFVTDFINFSNNISLVTSEIRPYLENKLQRLVDRKKEASSDQVQQLTEYMTFLKANSFSSEAEASFITDLQIKLTTEEEVATTKVFNSTTLEARVKALEAIKSTDLNQNSTYAQILLILDSPVKKAIEELQNQQQFKSQAAYQKFANRIKVYLDTMKANLQNAKAFSSDLKLKLDSYASRVSSILGVSTSTPTTSTSSTTSTTTSSSSYVLPTSQTIQSTTTQPTTNTTTSSYTLPALGSGSTTTSTTSSPITSTSVSKP